MLNDLLKRMGNEGKIRNIPAYEVRMAASKLRGAGVDVSTDVNYSKAYEFPDVIAADLIIGGGTILANALGLGDGVDKHMERSAYRNGRLLAYRFLVFQGPKGPYRMTEEEAKFRADMDTEAFKEWQKSQQKKPIRTTNMSEIIGLSGYTLHLPPELGKYPNIFVLDTWNKDDTLTAEVAMADLYLTHPLGKEYSRVIDKVYNGWKNSNGANVGDSLALAAMLKETWDGLSRIKPELSRMGKFYSLYGMRKSNPKAVVHPREDKEIVMLVDKALGTFPDVVDSAVRESYSFSELQRKISK